MKHLTIEQQGWARTLKREYPSLDDTMILTIVTSKPEDLEMIIERNNEGLLMGTNNPEGGSVCVSDAPEISSADSK